MGGDHGLLERRRTATARQRAGAQADRHGLARAKGRKHREGYELGNALLLGHEGGGREALAPKAARANRRRSRVYRRIDNLSCPLQTLNGERQQKADDLQLETSGRHRMDLPRKHSAQITENRLDVLASGLAQELFPCSHRPLGSLLALSFEVSPGSTV